jgi:hypothetical protein
VTWLRRWWGRRYVDTSDEARACLQQLEGRDAHIDTLGEELRAAQRRNHFSVAVNDAIARTRGRV